MTSGRAVLARSAQASHLKNDANKRSDMNQAMPCACALAIALLAGRATAQAPNPREPNVVVESGTITVDQDPIRLRRSHAESGRWQIIWVLARSGDYLFADDGIKVSPATEDRKLPDDLQCFRMPTGVRFVCSFKPRDGEFNYKYDVNVVGKDSGRISLDPIININF